jgi:hypothetical protein
VQVARALVLALALGHVTGVADMLMDDGCDDVCATDSCGDDCLPESACRCHCPSAMPIVASVARTASAIDAHAVAAFDAGQRMHASPDPREILHVPRFAV